jgi:NAD-dependent deacetylase
MLDNAIERVKQADILVIIGTSMQVFPAASLVNFIKRNTPVYFIDPNPSIEKNQYQNITIIKSGAENGTEELIKMLIY